MKKKEPSSFWIIASVVACVMGMGALVFAFNLSEQPESNRGEGIAARSSQTRTQVADATSGEKKPAGALVEYKSGKVWEEPKVITPGEGTAPPSDAIVLFDGKDLSQWVGGEKWKIEDGAATISGGEITTKQAFGDCQLHLEFATPAEVEGEGQGRGNSGVNIMGKYEIQILDSYENKTYFDGQCAALYKQRPPLVNACRKPGEWQTYDIIFKAPKFEEDGKLAAPGYVTVLHNGVLVQNHTEIEGTTSYIAAPAYETHNAKEPLTLMFHIDPVRYRNVWIREL